MVIPNSVVDFYLEVIADSVDQIRYLNQDVLFMRSLAEKTQDDEEKGLAENIVLIETQIIDSLKEEIQNARANLQRVGGI